MKFIKHVVSIIMMAIPLLVFATTSYTYTPGTVSITANSTYTALNGTYNVRYNPAVSKGQLSVAVSVNNNVQIYAVDSTTGVSFSCTITPATTPNYYELETLLLSVASGGNGVRLQALRNTSGTTCFDISIRADSASLD